MRKEIVGLASGFVLLLLMCSGIFGDLLTFVGWLFALRYSQPETSIFGGIVVRILCFSVSFELVGLIFHSIGWFNRKVMSAAYFVVSTLVGFILAFAVWTIEEHILIVGLILGIVFVVTGIAFVVRKILKMKMETDKARETSNL